MIVTKLIRTYLNNIYTVTVQRLNGTSSDVASGTIYISLNQPFPNNPIPKVERSFTSGLTSSMKKVGIVWHSSDIITNTSFVENSDYDNNIIACLPFKI